MWKRCPLNDSGQLIHDFLSFTCGASGCTGCSRRPSTLDTWLCSVPPSESCVVSPPARLCKCRHLTRRHKCASSFNPYVEIYIYTCRVGGRRFNKLPRTTLDWHSILIKVSYLTHFRSFYFSFFSLISHSCRAASSYIIFKTPHVELFIQNTFSPLFFLEHFCISESGTSTRATLCVRIFLISAIIDRPEILLL